MENEGSLAEIMNARMKSRVYFPVLAGLARKETDKHQPIMRTKQCIGRLAVYLKSAIALVDGALEIPRLLEDYQIHFCKSFHHVSSPPGAEVSTLDGIVHCMFLESTASEVRLDLERLNIFWTCENN